VREADDAEERRSARGLRRDWEVQGPTSRAEPRSSQHNGRLTPRSGEVQEAYAEEREVKGLTSEWGREALSTMRG
jgi:hypothetical protein